MGLGALGTGGLPGTLGAGFDARAGGGGFGLAATGGGGLGAEELDGRELSEDSAADNVFFQGVADPFAGPMPGKTETGFAFALAVTDWTETLAAVGVCFAAGAGGGG